MTAEQEQFLPSVEFHLVEVNRYDDEDEHLDTYYMAIMHDTEAGGYITSTMTEAVGND